MSIKPDEPREGEVTRTDLELASAAAVPLLAIWTRRSGQDQTEEQRQALVALLLAVMAAITSTTQDSTTQDGAR